MKALDLIQTDVVESKSTTFLISDSKDIVCKETPSLLNEQQAEKIYQDFIHGRQTKAEELLSQPPETYAVLLPKLYGELSKKTTITNNCKQSPGVQAILKLMETRPNFAGMNNDELKDYMKIENQPSWLALEKIVQKDEENRSVNKSKQMSVFGKDFIYPVHIAGGETTQMRLKMSETTYRCIKEKKCAWDQCKSQVNSSQLDLCQKHRSLLVGFAQLPMQLPPENEAALHHWVYGGLMDAVESERKILLKKNEISDSEKCVLGLLQTFKTAIITYRTFLNPGFSNILHIILAGFQSTLCNPKLFSTYGCVIFFIFLIFGIIFISGYDEMKCGKYLLGAGIVIIGVGGATSCLAAATGTATLLAGPIGLVVVGSVAAVAGVALIVKAAISPKPRPFTYASFDD